MATNVTLAPLLISSNAHECLKSWILITFKPARLASLVLLRYILESAIGLASETTKNQIKKRDKYLCQLCLKDNVYNYDDLQVHHIIPIAKNYDRRLDSDNLITLCRMHHEQAEKVIISKEELHELLEAPRRVGNPKI